MLAFWPEITSVASQLLSLRLFTCQTIVFMEGISSLEIPTPKTNKPQNINSIIPMKTYYAFGDVNPKQSARGWRRKDGEKNWVFSFQVKDTQRNLYLFNVAAPSSDADPKSIHIHSSYITLVCVLPQICQRCSTLCARDLPHLLLSSWGYQWST